MKIAITGNTSGIGQALEKVFTTNGHEVVGFSKTSGYDITNPDDRKRIINESSDCNIFINNAYHKYSQCELLFEAWCAWQGQHKRIVNISSGAAAWWQHTQRVGEENYKTAKMALESASEILWNKGPWPSVTIARPCLTDTPRVASITGLKKALPEHFAEILYNNLINQNFRIQMLAVSLDP